MTFVFLSVTIGSVVAQEGRDREQAKLFLEQAERILADTRAEDDARDLLVRAADFDTTFVKANFDAGQMHLKTIGKDRAVKYFMRI
ncbi:MAG: hypothetical protein ACKO13_15935, partial [Cytophagales bacterium]